ncbi:peptidoglycan DD-metalloendopeptidase family protein [bacterium]|nr:peptidoglycan DD-metalloendopeptidase family protein [bacterium]
MVDRMIRTGGLQGWSDAAERSSVLRSYTPAATPENPCLASDPGVILWGLASGPDDHGGPRVRMPSRWLHSGSLLLPVGIVLVGVVLLVAGCGSDQPASDSGMGGPVEQLPPLPPLVAEATDSLRETTASGPAIGRTVELRIQRNQTFYEALAALDVPHGEIMDLVRAVGEFRNLRKVRAGEVFTVEFTTRDLLHAFGFDLDLESWVRYERGEDGTFTQILGAYPVERRTVGVCSTIETSLYEALQACGAPLNLAAKMNDVLGWDIDFSRDPRRGDRFRIVYEEVYKDGVFVRTGPILACRYEGQRGDHAAYRYILRDDHTGYYDDDGNNLQKQLMRAPLSYSRISSGFSYRRLHPVLRRYMPHLGVDYAAPIGTPVYAAGDGVVVERGRKRGNGRYVRIRHTNREYETYYLHFSRFARGVTRGTKVRQGDVVGYVGASGYATGPHLDFRVKKSGTFVNPRTLKLPPAEPVPGDELDSFLALRFAYDRALGEIGAPSGAPIAIASLDEAGPPWWDARAHAALVLPPALRAAEASPPTLQ